MVNYYEVLQIDPKADQAVIRAAYRTLMRELHNHPDHGGNTADAQRINEAYSNLIDPQKRRMVDQRIRHWYAGSDEQRKESSPQSVRYIRCASCGATNRVFIGKLENNTMVQCGVCRSVLLCSRSSQSDAASKPLRKMLCHLTSDKWSETGERQEFFDTVLENHFFLKNFLYIKKVSALTRDNIHDIAQICKNTCRRHVTPVGNYFILVADRIAHISYVVESLKQTCAQMAGWSSGIIIPVDCSRKQVFLSHVNLNRHPADIMKLREYLFH